jgi:hypothetical protein
MAYGKGVSMPMSYWERIRNIWHISDWYHRTYRDSVLYLEEVISEDLGRKFDVLVFMSGFNFSIFHVNIKIFKFSCQYSNFQVFVSILKFSC